MGSYPSSPTDGDQVYSGAAPECVTGTLFAGNSYYFSAFAYRGSVFSPPAAAIASPTFKQDIDTEGDVGRDPSGAESCRCLCVNLSNT
ncbi:MAG: hypothetical protein MZV49_23985 [Rhodopseudomonas palustris]|nr:hypothetical protein [Rhodopseudomonas palustris]